MTSEERLPNIAALPGAGPIPSAESAAELRAGAARPRWRPTIAAILVFGFAGLVLVAVSAVLGISLGAAQKNTTSLIRQTAEFTVDSLIDRIGQHLGVVHSRVVFMAEMAKQGEISADDRAGLTEMLLGTLAGAPQVTGVAFFSAEGWSQRVGRGETGIVRLYDAVEPDPEIVQLVKQMRGRQESVWDGVFWVESLEQPQVTVTAPAYRGEDYIGVFAAVVSIQVLSNYVADFEREFDIHAFVLYGRDRVLAHPALIEANTMVGPDKPLLSLEEIGDPELAMIWSDRGEHIDILEGEETSLLGHLILDGDDPVFYLYRSVEGYGPEPFYMGVYARNSEIEQSEMDRLLLAGWVGLGILAASLVLAVVLARSIARPISDLSTAARAISSFDFRRVPAAKGSFFRELDSASGAFNSMLNGLRWFETYVPRSLVLRLIQLGEDGVQSEERQVTVIFTDIVGFTAASQNMSAQELADFLNHHFALLATEIEKTGGTVDKYIGDSVMAFWGAPDDQPDHALRACRAAKAISAALQADNRERIARGAPAVRLRMGVHSGPAVVGNIGAPGRVNYTLIGDTVNLANRLEAFGKEVAASLPGDQPDALILLSESTRKALGDDEGFSLEDLGEHQMRGRIGAIGVFRLLPGTISSGTISSGATS
ncbi:adenylate/guanylate cyclase domain-containing protein [Pelagibius litoralis]|uniref:Adenylate/guanylate cyclase domain-containing protein n=1 Tax=Pelagibius litoralis TaxID=374515 RepID=A0A967KCW1_9PROT|nr:adenylate/guanylate cyclase domain-containing protein [Pelagibius litoralis]NIA71084.1 adenylate/guanylate cyclase domain-containing protein [Pelagibius litoralis]